MINNALKPTNKGRKPHILCKEGDISEIVLLPGNPERVQMFRFLLDSFKVIANNREYTVAKGTYKGVEITICSTGIGGPSTEIAIIELIELGAKALIRIGGTSSLRKEVQCGDFIITTGSMRKGGSSNFYVEPCYPAVASYEVVESLIESCKSLNVRYEKGISASIGSYYAGQARPSVDKEFFESNTIEYYQKINVLNLEMESETIITLSNIFDVLTGCICAVHGNRASNEWLDDFEPAQKKMCEIALEACYYLYNKYL